MSSNTFGGTIKLEGESAYRKALSQIGSELRVMGSEMAKVTAEFGKNNTSTDALVKTNENLINKIDKQKDKIALLKGALEDSSAKYGENDKKTLSWKDSLNRAEAELITMQKQLERNNQIIGENAEELENNSKRVKEFGDENSKAGNNVLSLGELIKANLISDAINKGLSLLVDKVKEIGSAAIEVGKQALSSYGDYEQLTGGVETLFKDNADIVKKYANDAYKSSGLTANNYMETITSFSASLLQSLNGDTAKSAEIADMAIVDMSDNANKMGSSMESIQTAYQGFAKQNYTMLDNLKLGYGGTKSEMERLLKDAEKVSGIKYDISNLSDVYNAIHVIQGELDITGTTAKEASTTIQGSTAAMKSSWENLMVGIASGEGIEDSVNNFSNSLSTMLTNILPRIETITGGITNFINSIGDTILPNLAPKIKGFVSNIAKIIEINLPSIVETLKSIVSTLLNTFTEILPQLLPMGIGIINTIVEGIISMLPEIIQTGIVLLTELITGISENLPILVPTIIDAVILMVETLIDNIDMLIDAAIQLVMGLADGLIEAVPRLIEKAPIIIQKLFDAIVRNLPKIFEAGGELVGRLASGLLGSIYKLLEVAPKLIGTILNGIGEQFEAFKEAGGNLISGIWQGISNKWEWLKEKIFSFANGITDSIKSFFGIHSPSKLFEDEIGVNLALGVGSGFDKQMQDVKEQMQEALPSTLNTDLNYGMSTPQSTFSIERLEEAFTRALSKSNQIIVMDKEKVGAIISEFVDEKFGYEV